MAHWDLLQANVVERDMAAGAFISQFYCTSGAIQKGVPTEVFLLRRVFVSWAETPARKRIHSLDTVASLSGRALRGDNLHDPRNFLDTCFFVSLQTSDRLLKVMICEEGNSEQ